MAKDSKTFLARARSWTKKQGLHGPGAFLRFVMMTFVERLNAAGTALRLVATNG